LKHELLSADIPFTVQVMCIWNTKRWKIHFMYWQFSSMKSILAILCFLHFGYGFEKVSETSKDTDDGFKFKIKRSLFTKIPNVKLKTTDAVNIIQQSGKACQDLIPCLSFLFYRKKQSLNCLLINHSVNKKALEDDNEADYYEIEVITYLFQINEVNVFISYLS